MLFFEFLDALRRVPDSDTYFDEWRSYSLAAPLLKSSEVDAPSFGEGFF